MEASETRGVRKWRRFTFGTVGVGLATAACGGDGAANPGVTRSIDAPSSRGVLDVVRASDATLRARFGSLGATFARDAIGFSATTTSGRGAHVGATADADWSFAADANPRHRVAFTPLDHARVAGALDDGRVVFDDVAPSTDAAISAGDGWTELAWVLRDERAPRAFRFRSSAPLRREGDGLALLDESGRALAHVAPPFAVDARGKRRAAEIVAIGDVVSIAFDATGLHFPIVLDPYIATATWVKQTLEPPPRSLAMLAPNGAAGAVLFGGAQLTARLDDTWTYDGARWLLQHPVHVPPSNAEFGGVASGHAFMTSFGMSPTWVWDGADWNEKSALGVTASSNIASIGDDAAVVVADPSGTGSAVAIFDGTSWTTVAAIGASPASSASAYGELISNGTSAVFFDGNDTWTWSPTANWKLVDSEPTAPPWSRYRLSGSIGGVPTLVSRESTWTWSGSTWSQHDISGAGPVLTGFISTPSGYADIGGKIGEMLVDQNGTQRLWSFDGTNWNLANDVTVPSIELGAFTGFGDQVLYIGGLGTTWTWSGGAWSQNSVAVDPSTFLDTITALAPTGSTALGIGVNSDNTLVTLVVDATHVTQISPAHPLPWTGDLTTLTAHLSTVGDTTLAAIADSKTSSTHLASWTGSDWEILDDLPAFRVDSLGGIGAQTLILGYDTSDAGATPTGWSYPSGGPIASFQGAPLPTDVTSGSALIGIGRYALLNTGGAAPAQALWDGQTWANAAVSGLPPIGEPMFASTGSTAYLLGGYIGDITPQNDLYVLALTLEDGIACKAASDCGSGFCAQSVCCDRACDGVTESCALAATVGTCAPIQAVCTGVSTLQGADGTTQECAPYLCKAGACVIMCATSSDCVGGYVCDTSSALCVAPSTAPTSGGCAFGLASPRRSPASAFALALTFIAIATGRRRAH